MANSVDYTISLIDKLSGPARQMLAQLKAVDAQLKTVKESAAGRAGTTTARLPKDPVFGPGRKEFLAARRFEEREAARAAKESLRAEVRAARDADRVARGLKRDQAREVAQLSRAAATLDKQRGAALFKQFRERERAEIKAAKDLERAQSRQVREAKRAAKERSNSIRDALANAPGARTVAQIKDLGAGFQALTGISPKAAAGIAAVGIAAAAATVAVAGLVVGFGALVFAGARLALEASEAKADTLDMLEAMLGTEKAARDTYGQLLGITKVTSASKEQLTTAAQELSAAGVTSQRQLVDSVKALAQVESVLKGGGSRIQSVIEKAAQTGKFEVNAKRLAGTGVQIAVLYEEIAKRTGLGVKQVEAQLKAGKIKTEVGIDALTATIDRKFGGVAAKQAMDFGVQMQRLRDNIGGLFADVNTGPFLDALGEIVSVFDSAMPAGAAMKDMLTAAFNGVFKAVAAGAPYVKTFLKGLVIIGLQVAIALKPLIARLREAFGGDAKKGPLDLAKTMSLIGLAARAVVGVFAQILAFKPVWDSLAATISSIGTVVSGFMQGGFLGAFNSIGAAVVNGIVAGITSTAGVLFKAATDLAANTIARFKSAFQIHSPSKVMMGMGLNLDAGLAMGIKAGAPAVNDNMRAVVQPVPPPRVNSLLGGRPRDAGAVTFGPGAVVVQVIAHNIQELESKLEDVMANVMERAALAQGTAA
jgi:hypothetical protein